MKEKQGALCNLVNGSSAWLLHLSDSELHGIQSTLYMGNTISYKCLNYTTLCAS